MKNAEPRGVVFLSLHTPGDEENTIRRLLEIKNIPLVFAIDRARGKDDMKSEMADRRSRYGINGYPTTILIDRAGKIAFRNDDPGNKPAFEAALKELGLNIDSDDVTEEQASQVIERFLDRAIEKILNEPRKK